MDVGKLVRSARLTSGLSQREVAQRAGVPQSTIARIERGTIRPRSDTLLNVVSALGQELVLLPRPGARIDRTLIRRFLSLSPKERIEYAATGGTATRALRKAVTRS